MAVPHICCASHLLCISVAAAVLGYKDSEGRYRGEIVTVRHNGRNEAEAARIRSKYADVTRILEVRTWLRPFCNVLQQAYIGATCSSRHALV